MVKAQPSQPVKCRKPKKEEGGKEKRVGTKKGKERKKELKERKKKKDKKECHRHRRKTLALGNGDALDCCVLLTRLEEKGVVGKKMDIPKAGKHKQDKAKKKQNSTSIQRRTKSGLKKMLAGNQQALEPKNNQFDTLLMFPAPVLEPRRRRMASLNAEAVNSLLLYKDDSLISNLTKKRQPSNEDQATDSGSKVEHRGCETKKVPPGGKADPKERPKKQRRSAVEAQEIDWLALFAPTPRRQAGLTAATLLKLTGSRSFPAGSTVKGCCSLCKSESQDPEWKANTGGKECLKHPLHCGSSLGFSLKTIKEEQVESEVSSCYCCTQERCVEYCHRMSPHPASITISPHRYTCFPGYYVHFSHPDSSPSSIPPLALCSRSDKRPKLLPSRGSQPSGITHPVYCCTSVEACYTEPSRINGYPAYTNLIPAITRGGRSFSSTDCTKCNHSIKREDYPSTLGDHHSPSSIPICPSPRTLTGCPISNVPPAGQSVPHTQAPLSDPSQPQPPLQVAKECPQSAKSPSGSRSGTRGTGSIGSADCPLNRDKKQKLGPASVGGRTVAKQPKNGRQKATNGWRPVGVPYQREVFSVGEEAMVLRTCYEGVQRDGELICVRDAVLLKSGPRKKTLPYVAKISALWMEPETGELMMSLFWYYRPEHTQGGRNPNVHCENEIFASRHQDVNSVACIEDKCYVLTLAQYCRFCALVKRRREGVRDSAASLLVPPIVGNAMPTHHCVPDDVDPELVYFCRHVYDFRYGRLLKNLQ
uniref:Bromo adjacent homology domain containing 1 n=1 Tax=Labrus bergylta TaxID=56723 RepID=A0A3Q3G679_9LABR